MNQVRGETRLTMVVSSTFSNNINLRPSSQEPHPELQGRPHTATEARVPKEVRFNSQCVALSFLSSNSFFFCWVCTWNSSSDERLRKRLCTPTAACVLFTHPATNQWVRVEPARQRKRQRLRGSPFFIWGALSNLPWIPGFLIGIAFLCGERNIKRKRFRENGNGA